MNITEKVQKIKSGELTAVENLMNFSEKIVAPEIKDLNIVLALNENAIEQAKKIDERIKQGKEVGKLAGVCYTLKANISYKGIETNCASKVLEGYVSAYNATVVNKLLAEDAIFIGMVNMDEFASGVSGETSAFGPTKNPINPELIPGGSSSGPAASVAAGICDFSLGSDTGGSIRNPASHCGVVGLKPSYGLVSRYGLIDLCMSFDCIGPLTKTARDAEVVLDIIRGQDNFDTTTVDGKYENKVKKVIGLVNVEGFATKDIEKMVTEKAREIAEKKGYKIQMIDLPLDIALETYYILAYTEFFSGTRKFDGRRFGREIDKFAGPEVQRRIIGGSEITRAEFAGRYYSEALKARNFIKKEFEKLFLECDAIIMPTVPKLAHLIGEQLDVKEMYAYDVFTVLANIAQIPSISVPIGEIGGKRLGMQVMAPRFAEKIIFDLVEAL